MNRNERYESQAMALLEALRGERADIWTALPGIVQSFDATKRTCVVQPTVRARIDAPSYRSTTMIPGQDGDFVWDQLPLLLDCPVFFPSGGGCVLTFPVAQGDECLVVIASRCIDAWWQNGGINNPTVMRMHDLSDGFAFVGVSSVPNVQAGISATSAQLRTNDGAAYIELVGSGGSAHDVAIAGNNLNVNMTGNVTLNVTGTVNIAATGAGTCTAASWTFNGPATFNGPVIASSTLSVTGLAALNGGFSASGGGGAYSIGGTVTVTDLVIGTKHVGGHTHTDPQGGTTGPM